MRDMSFLERVLELAKEKRISQRELARRIDIDPSRITEWKRRLDGDPKGRGPSLDEAMAIADVLGASLAYFVGETDQLVVGDDEELTKDELAVVQAYRAFRPCLDQDKAIRALSAAFNAESSAPRSTVIGQPADPETGEPLAPPNHNSGKRRRQA